MLGFLIFVVVFLILIYLTSEVVEKKLKTALNVDKLNNTAETIVWFASMGMVVAAIGALQLLLKVVIFVLMLF